MSREGLRELLIRIMQNNQASLSTISEAATLIALDAKFNQWIATSKGSLDEDRLLLLVDVYEDVVDECRALFEATISKSNEEFNRILLPNFDRWREVLTRAMAGAGPR